MSKQRPPDGARARAKELEPVGFRPRLDRDGWSSYDRTMRAFLCEVDETGLRRFLTEDVLAGDGVRGYLRHRFARPTTVAWTLLDGDAESIRSAVAAGHHEAACGLLLHRAIELLSLAATLPETTLPAWPPHLPPDCGCFTPRSSVCARS
jgi:hypothetical protein